MLDWIQYSGLAHIVQQSLWGYAFVLSSHAIGMAILVGLALMVNLRLLGIAPGVPLAALRTFVKIALIGFVINFVSGSILFAADAYYFAGSRSFQVKLALLIASGVILAVTYRQLPAAATANAHPAVEFGKALPAFAIVVWIGVITSGRLMAYL